MTIEEVTAYLASRFRPVTVRMKDYQYESPPRWSVYLFCHGGNDPAGCTAHAEVWVPPSVHGASARQFEWKSPQCATSTEALRLLRQLIESTPRNLPAADLGLGL